MKRLVVDLDGTLTIDDPTLGYADRRPALEIIAKLRHYKQQGFEIIIATSRNMQTHSNSIGKINAFTLPIVIDWLQRHDVPYDEIHVGKPWCGHDGFYIDDKAIRPSELRTMSYEAIRELLAAERTDGNP
jgi:capsule biosynthesis phosphatase